jgi:hypothetical protein
MLPLFLTGAVLAGCDDKAAKSPDPATAAKAADAKAEADKDAADAKAKADKSAANAKAAAEKSAADAKTAAVKAAAEAGKDQAAKLLSDLGTAVKGAKWTDAEAIIKQLDALRDKLPADKQASFDSLKKQYNDNKSKL